MSDSPSQPTRPHHDNVHDCAELELSGERLTLEALDALWERRLKVRVDPAAWAQVERGAALVRKCLQDHEPHYGINTGFGHLCTVRVSADQLRALQENLLLSHAVGVGPPVPRELVRWMLLFKIMSLLKGYSGVTRATVEGLMWFLNGDLLPWVPTRGSLGASGDLAPLAHMVLPLIGRGMIVRDGRPVEAGAILKEAGFAPIALQPKEGLALINGTQLMTAYGAALVIRARRLAKHADAIACMSLEAYRGSVRPFDPRLHEIRPHRGAQQVAENVRRMMADSEILISHENCGKVQDPYSLRCVPQVHGASRDAIEHAAGIVTTEINSVTDNPILFENGDVISGGNFHGQSLALCLDYLAIAVAELASISERRVYLLLSGPDGLPNLLMQDTGLNSGFMLPQYTAAALVSENKVLASPASVDSIPTSLGQEDHVSMGAHAALKAWQVMENAETVLAIELMCAAQALDFRAPLEPGIGPRMAHRGVREEITHAQQDREFGRDMQRALAILRSQRITRAIEEAIGPVG